MNAHSHGLNNHTHSFGGTTSDMSANKTGHFYVNAGGSSSTSTTYGNISNESISGTTAGTTSSSYRVGYVINVAHTHTYSGTTGGNGGNTTNTTSTGSFTGSTGTTSSTGGGSSFSILPPYLVKYCWERTA